MLMIIQINPAVNEKSTRRKNARTSDSMIKVSQNLKVKADVPLFTFNF